MNTPGNHYVEMDEMVIYETVDSFKSIYASPPRIPKLAAENNYYYFESGKFNYTK